MTSIKPAAGVAMGPDAAAVRRGRPSNPTGFRLSDAAIRMLGCPDCDGRGWFLINPFATGGPGGAGGFSNMCQCLTCLDSKRYYDAFGELPPSVVADMQRHKAARQPRGGAETAAAARAGGALT